MLATRGSGLQELDVLWPGNGFDYCYPDGCSRVLLPQWYCVRILGTVLVVWCWLLSPPDRKISSVNTLSVVVGEMFKTREAMPALTQAFQGKVRQVSSAG